MSDSSLISSTVEHLCNDNLIIFPTETVYGMGANALSYKAVDRIYKEKNRPISNPLIVHVSSYTKALAYGVFSEEASRLAQQFWPGPLTLVVPLKVNSGIAANVTAGLSSVAIRVPNHPLALSLLTSCPFPLAAPSANPSGYLSPTHTTHIHKDFSHILCLNGQQSLYGLESTIIDTTHTPCRLLRHGSIALEDLVATAPVIQHKRESTALPTAPGQLNAHYAPQLPLYTNCIRAKNNGAYLGFGPCSHADLNLSPEGNLEEAAYNLFSMLHTLDTANYSAIYVAPIPTTGIGAAINDRLHRAKAGHS